jgi:hypothetical protein
MEWRAGAMKVCERGGESLRDVVKMIEEEASSVERQWMNAWRLYITAVCINDGTNKTFLFLFQIFVLSQI